ncbi:MAG: beta strand repeat-containing protein [Patescibacteria group bacterium]
MIIFHKNRIFFRKTLGIFLMLVFFISGFPSEMLLKKIAKTISDGNIVDSLYLSLNDSNVIDKKMANLLTPSVNKAEAATYKIQTGYYIGNGGVKSISGLGFKPEMVILKSNTSAGSAVIKTSAMPSLNTAYLGVATADNTTGLIIINSDGFSVTTAVGNTNNVRYTWTAFAGSDCSATGTFCVGSYTGTGAAKAVPVGFQPNLVMVKQSTAVAANWRSSAMPANAGQYFMATTQNTAGALFTTLDATGFSVGTTNSASGGVYYFAAFKSVAGSVNVGTYTGNATDNRNITGVGFVPDFVFLKNANAATAVSGVFSTDESYGDSSSYFAATANLVDSIQALQTDGFQVGINSTSNGSGNIIYYAAFGGTNNTRNASGAYQMAEGSYTGTGQYLNITGLDFKPDLVIVKASTAVVGVFRTSLMGGDSTAYLDSATGNIIGAISSINPDGFTVYNHVTTNTVGTVYHWQAFGNAWSPETNSGAGDFYIGAYYGNGLDNRNITRLPFQADMLAVKVSSASVVGVFRTSSHVGDLTSTYGATADVANHIQSLSADGFQTGNSTSVNSAAGMFFYFGFKNGTNFKVGKYTGNGVNNLSITDPGFDPDLVWIKRNTNVAGVQRPRTLTGDLTQYFTASAQAAGKIKAFVTNGFQLGTGTEVNLATGVYIYVAWKKNSTQNTTPPSYKIQTGYYVGNGGAKSISGLGFKPEMIIIKSNTTASAGVFKTSAMPTLNTAYLGSATADNSGASIVINSDGFSVVGTITNTLNVGYTWTAFAGSDCSATGTFCVGSYTGTGAAKAVPVGFQPNLVMVKQSTAVAANWRSSAMPANAGQYFMATTQNTAGALFTTLDATGFSVGTTNSASGGVYYFAAFKSVAGSVNVGTYTGNATDNRNITGVGFVPDFVFLKNANAATAVSGVFSTDESYGDSSSYFAATANLVDSIQALQTDGFQVGINSTSNGSGNIIYYVAFGGAIDTRNSSGTYKMAEGTYTGTGQYLNITGLDFKPDLVIVRSDQAQSSVFRTSLIGGDVTLDFSVNSSYAGAVTSINSDGFTVYNHVTTNTAGTVYHWQAFGNAWNPEKNSGASDFYIGAYYGSYNTKLISRFPFQADMVVVGGPTATRSSFRTSSHGINNSSFFSSRADFLNSLQSFSANGFQVGLSSNTNSFGFYYYFFGFKNSANFKVGKYTGTGVDNLSITDPGFDPDLVWIKRNTAIAAVQRPITLVGNLTQSFEAYPLTAGMIKAFITNGFQLGIDTAVNSSSGVYYYVAWKIPSGVVVGYPAYGELTSIIFDTTGVADGPAYNSIMWRGNYGGPALNQGIILFQIASSDNPSGPWNYFGTVCTGDADDWYSNDPDFPTSIGCYNNHNNKRYFRYKIRICSSDCSNGGEYTPQVNEVMISWSP